MSDNKPNDDIADRLEQAEQLKLMGQYKEAIAILEAVLIEDPENVAALEEIADNELSLDSYERAEQAAKQVINLDKASYTGFYILGFIRSFEEKWTEAEELLKKANKLKPNNPEILRCLGWVLFNRSQKAQGIVTLERALNLDNENPLTMCDLGVAYLQVKNFDKAKVLFQNVLEYDPDNKRAQECIEAVERLQKSLQAGSTAQKKQ